MGYSELTTRRLENLRIPGFYSIPYVLSSEYSAPVAGDETPMLRLLVDDRPLMIQRFRKMRDELNVYTKGGGMYDVDTDSDLFA
jgi:hypothetical protein